MCLIILQWGLAGFRKCRTKRDAANAIYKCLRLEMYKKSPIIDLNLAP